MKVRVCVCRTCSCDDVWWFQELSEDNCSHTYQLNDCCHHSSIILLSPCLSLSLPVSLSPLMKAARNGHSDIIKVLLDAGAAIEAKDKVSKRISICICVCLCVCYILAS